MTQFNSTREQVAFLARRATWGLAPGELDVLDDGGVPPAVDTRSMCRSALEWLGGPGGADGVFEEDLAVLGLLTA